MSLFMQIGVLLGPIDCRLFRRLWVFMMRSFLLVLDWLLLNWFDLRGSCAFIIFQTCLFLSASNTAHINESNYYELF